MKLKTLILIAMLLGSVAISSIGEEKADISIMFVGKNDKGRMDDYVQLLEKHFTSVESAEYEDFTFDAEADYDVLMIDFFYGPEWRGVPVLPEDWSKATVLISSGDRMFGGWAPGPIFTWL